MSEPAPHQPSPPTPTEQQALVQEFWDAILDRLKTKEWAETTCPVCKGHDWTLQEMLVEIPCRPYRPFRMPASEIGFGIGQHYPSVAAICDTCGMMLLWNVYALLGDEIRKFPPYNRELSEE